MDKKPIGKIIAPTLEERRAKFSHLQNKMRSANIIYADLRRVLFLHHGQMGKWRDGRAVPQFCTLYAIEKAIEEILCKRNRK